MGSDDMSILITCVSPADSMLRSLSKINSHYPPGWAPFPVQIEDHLPVRIGQTVRTQLLYPVYANDILALSAQWHRNCSPLESLPLHQRAVSW